MNKVVFTNGCFDIIHPGHIDLLTRAKELGTKLVVGINSDASVRTIKGPDRPFQSESARKAVLESIRPVDEVIIFTETTPERLIKQIRPNVLVKGGDWKINEIIGADFVIQHGGEVHSLPLFKDYSTTSIIDKTISTSVAATPTEISADRDLVDQYLKDVRSNTVDIAENLAGNIVSAWALIEKSISEGQPIYLILDTSNTKTSRLLETRLKEVLGDRLKANFHSDSLSDITPQTFKNACLIIGSDCGDRSLIETVMNARQSGSHSIALSGLKGRKLAAVCDSAILAPSDDSTHILECHLLVVNIWKKLSDHSLP